MEENIGKMLELDENLSSQIKDLEKKFPSNPTEMPEKGVESKIDLDIPIEELLPKLDENSKNLSKLAKNCKKYNKKIQKISKRLKPDLDNWMTWTPENFKMCVDTFILSTDEQIC